MDKLNKDNLLQGTWIMAFAAVFSKILSAGYRIPLQNLVGDHGYYVYQQVYWIYGIFAVLSLTGLPLLISKFFINKTESEVNQTMHDVFWLLSYFSIVLISLLEIFAPNIAKIMGDIRLVTELRMASLVYLFVPIESVIRASYQSRLDVKVSALSQMIEQLIRVAIIITVAIFFIHNSFGVYEMGTLANFAAVIAAFAASSYLIYCYSKFVKDTESKKTLHPTFNKLIAKRLLVEGGSIVVITGILIFFQLIDSISIVPNLIKRGMDIVDAGIQKGIFDRAQPLAQLGIVVVTSFLTVMVPANELDKEQGLPVVTKMLHFCIIFSVAETVGLIALIRPINITLFKDDNNSSVIAVFLISIALYSVINILVTLNKKSYYKKIIQFLLFSLIVKWVLNNFLIKSLGLMGASIATALSLTLLLILLLSITDQRIKKSLRSNHFVSKVVIISIIMFIVVKLSLVMGVFLPDSRLGNLVQTIIGIIVGVITFVHMIIKLKVFSKEEFRSIPILKRIIK